MKSMIIIPVFFLAMLLALIIYDCINAAITKKDLLLKEDRIYFNEIVSKSNNTSYPLNIDSLHYVVFEHLNNHERRLQMLQHVDSMVSAHADEIQMLQ